MEFSPLKALSQPFISADFHTLSPVAHSIATSRGNSVSGTLGRGLTSNRKGQGFWRVEEHLLKKPSSSSSPLRSSGVSVAAMAASVEVKKGAELKVYEQSSELGQDLAAYVAALSAAAISARGSFSVVLSGGSLISSLEKLTEEPYVGKIEWSKWQVFWADERVVPLDHPNSNYKLAYDGLLSKVSIPPGQVYAINEKLSPQSAAVDYELVLQQLVKTNVLLLADRGLSSL